MNDIPQSRIGPQWLLWAFYVNLFRHLQFLGCEGNMMIQRPLRGEKNGGATYVRAKKYYLIWVRIWIIIIKGFISNTTPRILTETAFTELCFMRTLRTTEEGTAKNKIKHSVING